MSSLVFGQLSLWLFIILNIIGIAALGIGCILLRKEPHRYSWQVSDFTLKERTLVTMAITSVVAILFYISTYFIGFQSSNVSDFCYLNGHVVSATYEEEWTEEYWETETYQSGTDSKGNATYSTRTVRKTRHHSPEWNVESTLGDDSISQMAYYNLTKTFGNQSQIGNGHSGQCSYGDGRTFKTVWNVKVPKVPISKSLNVINWVAGSQDTVEKKTGASNYRVLGYPGLYTDHFGIPKVGRVLNDGVKITPEYQKQLLAAMDDVSDNVGASKQCNPMIYFTSQDMGVYEAIKTQWVNGKKNDCIVVIGVKEWPKIEWVNVIAWTTDHKLYPMMRDNVMNVGLNDPTKLSYEIQSTINKHFSRNRMRNFEYLKDDIQVPSGIYPWCIGFFILSLVAVFFIPKINQ